MAGVECKLCLKKFSNGRAMGGHMRSHYSTLPLPPKTPQLSSRSKRVRGIGIVEDDGHDGDGDEQEVVCKEGFLQSCDSNDVDDDLSVEDVASCLLMLSKDHTGILGGGYRCEQCGRIFKSSQGLGSHRNSHSKKIKKVGDRKSSFGGSLVEGLSESCSDVTETSRLAYIDLNLPAAMEDEDDGDADED